MIFFEMNLQLRGAAKRGVAFDIRSRALPCREKKERGINRAAGSG
jgi:hypothetical protein